MGARIVETLYPTSTINKGGVRIWDWIMSKLGLESSEETIVEEKSEVCDSKSLYFPWHLLKSVDGTLYIIDRRCMIHCNIFCYNSIYTPSPLPNLRGFKDLML